MHTWQIRSLPPSPHSHSHPTPRPAVDTAKAANLYYSHPAADFLEFINAPVGAGAVPTLPLRPLIAIPTTAGTGSETTGTAIFDFVERGAKTGISHRALRPTLGLVDPENTATMPPEVAAASGFDVLCHALESYTNLPFNARSPRPASPALRPACACSGRKGGCCFVPLRPSPIPPAPSPADQGANPVSDVWSMQALRLIARYFVRAVKDRGDEEANAAMTLAASFAGAGFGNAGVHLCHGLSYAISGQNKSWVSPGGYDPSVPLIPHGVSVVLTAPAVFRCGRWLSCCGRMSPCSTCMHPPPAPPQLYGPEQPRAALGGGAGVHA